MNLSRFFVDRPIFAPRRAAHKCRGLHSHDLRERRSAQCEPVEKGLRTLLRLKQQTELRKLRGKYEWEGDLDGMRRDK